MSIAIACGTVLGIGVLMLVIALTAGRRSVLAQVLAVDAALPQRVAVAGPQSLQQRIEKVMSNLVHTNPAVARLVGADLAADLRIMGMDAHAHLVYKLSLAAVGFVAAPAVFGVVAALLELPILAGIGVGMLAAIALFAVPDSNVRKEATKRRRDFSAALTSYLDLVALRAASGSAVSEALLEASSVGAGYGWRRVRSALNDARFAGKSPAAGLEALGRELDIRELVELSSQLALVDDTGAQTESTLRAKADALRARARSDMEGDANQRSTTMVLGQALFAVGFLILIGYPAVLSLGQM